MTQLVRPEGTSFAELLAMPGVEEIMERRSTVGFLAFHGGSLERGTDIIASLAARAAGASYYGVVQPPDIRWHLPSTQVTPAASPVLREFLDHVEVAVAVHGFGRVGHWASLLLGGGNRALASHVARCLRPALPDYDIVTDLDRIPAELRGLDPRNPVNRPRGSGVQLELPPRVRGNTPNCPPADAAGLVPDSRALVEALAAAASSWRGWADAEPGSVDC
ncbi:MAG: poly-gamma-glutamate hydrolase family protein [Actinomycetota bacterium]|nr:poly-gamma-glutamate hydrolase family protein [Actinomycetota bacterium]